jgi:acetyltransferase-like isoleucine patch superfamily enzyme
MDAQLLVLDEDLHLCGPEVEGQICIRSPYLAKEVLDPKGVPLEVFKQNPYSSDTGDKIYPTGDFGVYRADGSVVCLGRRDKQVKILGHRVQLEEIEIALTAEPALLNYHLVSEADEFGGTILTLYAVSEGKLEPQSLKGRLKEKLPDFMVPQRIVQLREIPLTPNGKVDLARLKQAENQPGEAEKNGKGGPASLDSARARLLKIFSPATSHPALGSEENLLAAGLNSLQAITACCAIEEEFGITLSVQDLVECGNVNGLAARLQVGSAVQMPSQVQRLAACGGPTPTPSREPHVRLLPRHENVLVGTKNRMLQLLARIAPEVWRVKLHKWRGVQIGQDVAIGYDTIVETAYPWLVRIGNYANIGMRVTILAHFRGMAGREKGSYSVDIQDYVFIGPHAVILPNVTIGEGAVITAGSVVNTDIPPMVLAHGNPAVPIAKCGAALAGETQYADFMRKLKPL